MFSVLFVFSLSIIIVASFNNEPWLTSIGIVAEVIFSWLICKALDQMNTDGHSFKLLWHCIRYCNTDVRLSFSYLFRIQVDGKYLLVKGNRLKNQFQPVGGVYKYYDEAKPALDGMKYRPDVKMGNSDETDDLRIRIKGRYLLRFMDWFLSMKDREYDPYREFKEELIESNFLPENSFKVIEYRKVFVHNKGVTFSIHNDCRELIYADIFELKMSAEQEAIIKKAVIDYPDLLCLATDSELKSECYNGVEKNIGNNGKWIIGG